MSARKLASLIPTAALVFLVVLGALIYGGRNVWLISGIGENWSEISTTHAAGLALDLLRQTTFGPDGFFQAGNTPTDDIPETVDDWTETDEDTPVSTDVADNDVLDSNEEYALTVSAQPNHGIAIHDDEFIVTYTPEANFNGTDSYLYQICSTGEGGSCDEATVNVTVKPVNDPPVAADDFVPMDQSQPLVIDVLKNDSDVDGDALTAVLDAQPGHGSVVLNGDSTFTYTPDDAFNGLDNFTYHANDGQADSNVADVVIDVSQPDVEQPSLTWIAPVNDTEVYNVSGETIVLEVEASDNQSVDYVLFRRWDAPTERYITLGTVDSPPYSLEVDTSTLNVGWNQINARAVDTSGNFSEEAYIWLLKSTSLYLPMTQR